MDISGSDGASIENSYQSVKKLELKQFGYEEIGSVKLYGDWVLRIKFTYTIKKFGEGSAIPKSLLS